MILTKLKETAEAYLRQPANSAVISVLAYFNDSLQQATKDAGTLLIKQIINRPIAVAVLTRKLTARGMFSSF